MAQRSSRRNRSRGGKQGRGRRTAKLQIDPNKAWMPDPPPHREYPPCPLSGEPIDDIYSAVADPRTGNPVRMESVIAKFTEQESLGPDERICYVGEGQFGVVRETTQQNGKRVLEIVKRIPYEDHHEKQPWRKELSPGISRDYVPQPSPIHELYTPEEQRTFPRFGRISTGSSSSR